MHDGAQRLVTRSSPDAPRRPDARTIAVRLLIVLLGVSLAFLMRLALDPILEQTTPLTIFLGAVALITWYAGGRCGVAAAAVFTLLADYFFNEPRHEFDFGLKEFLGMALFFSANLLLIYALEKLRRTCSRLEYSERTNRAAREEIARVNLVLEHKVAERTARLRETVSELERYSYSIAHDLRAPLRSMHIFSQILLDEHAQDLPPKGQDYLRRIAAAAHRLDRLVQDVLSYSRVSQMKIQHEPVDLEALLAQIVEQYPGFQSPHARIHLRRPLLPVTGNLALLTQCVSNLLGNAVKFVPKGVTPQVTIHTEPRDGHVRLWVEDNGIGIAPEHQERIFHIFERIHSKDAYDGTGIGLSIVRKAVERMGGRLGVDSALGQGSRFWVELPSA